MSAETPRPGLAETLLTALHADNGVYRYGAEEGADAALSWLSDRLTDDDVVEAAAEELTHWRDYKDDARAALSAAAAVIGDHIETRLNDCDTEALRRNRKHRELLAEAWDEGWFARDEAEMADAVVLTPPDAGTSNPYRAQAIREGGDYA